MQRWPRVLDLLKIDIGEKDFGKWIKPTKLLSIDGGVFTLSAPNPFISSKLQRDYGLKIRQSITSVYETTPAVVEIACAPEEADERVHTPQPERSVRPNGSNPSVVGASGQTPNRIHHIPFKAEYTFDSFIVGPANQFAHAACQAAAENPGKSYNPLFIYGGVGLGKTHLLNAIANNVRDVRPESRICYLSCEQFINDLINSLRTKKMDDFRRRYRNSCDLLLIDDVQFIAGKERSQEEFFHTFNSLHELGKQIVLTSDKFPKEIPGLEERLRSRFEWGLIADIQPPEFETRVAILEKKAEQLDIDLSADVAIFIAENIHDNVRELEGALIRLNAYASLMGGEVDLPFAKRLFQKLVTGNKPINIEQIQAAVAKSFNLRTSELLSSRKFKYIALPRQIAMFLSRKLTNASFPDIGSQFGGKDHSTVVHAVKKIEKLIPKDPSLQNTLESLEKTIKLQAKSA